MTSATRPPRPVNLIPFETRFRTASSMRAPSTSAHPAAVPGGAVDPVRRAFEAVVVSFHVVHEQFDVPIMAVSWVSSARATVGMQSFPRGWSLGPREFLGVCGRGASHHAHGRDAFHLDHGVLGAVDLEHDAVPIGGKDLAVHPVAVYE